MMKENPPEYFFDKELICPFCEEHIKDKPCKLPDGSVPYIRHRDKLHFCHVKCYLVAYECMKRVVERIPKDDKVFDEVMLEML